MVILANANPITDGSAYDMLSHVQSDLPIVLVSKAPGFRFNEELLKLDKWVLCCFVEYNWDWNFVTSHIWGENTGLFMDALDNNNEYLRFDNFVRCKPPVFQFKRELFKYDVREDLLPIEYAARYELPPTQSRQSFNDRPIDVFFSWGLSNEKRKWLHADIWKASSKYGYSVCDNIYHLHRFLEEEKGRKWVTTNIPHYARLDMEKILSVNGLSKVSISPPGAGLRCFRHGESPINSIMAMPKMELAWSYEWRDLVNCIEYNEGNATDSIQEYLNLTGDTLYQIYRAGVENAKNYYLPSYVKNYLEPTIKKFA
jgi:hypothetical protein